MILETYLQQGVLEDLGQMGSPPSFWKLSDSELPLGV